MDDYSRGIEEFREFVEKERAHVRILRKSVKGMISGKLMISNNKGGMVFYRVDHRNGVYCRKKITGNDRAKYMLGHKSYEEERLRRKEHNLSLYEMILPELQEEDSQSIIAGMPRGSQLMDQRRLVDPYCKEITWPKPSRDPDIKPEEAVLYISGMSPEEWASLPYCENTKDLKYKTHRSRRGVLCRSKGEASLLDVADELGYRYRYDCVIVIDGMEISPDLIIFRPDGKLIFVEHHGWIDESNGDADFLRKLWTYSRRGIIQGRNLLVTFDKPDGSADTELIRRQLQNMMEIA